MHIDRDAGFVELEAEVIGRDADWLELLVCTAGGREHESLLRTPALPSHVQLGLLLLGLEPGRPAHTGPGGNFLDAEGPELRVTLHSPGGAFPSAEAGGWVLDRTSGASLLGGRWRYTGSRVVEDATGPAFLADVNGTLTSLVSFGDDLVLFDAGPAAAPLDAGNDGQRFAASPAVPPAGSAVLVRLQAAPGGGAVDTGPVGPDDPGPSPEIAPDPPQDAE